MALDRKSLIELAKANAKASLNPSVAFSYNGEKLSAEALNKTFIQELNELGKTPQDFRDTKSKFLIKLYEGPISKYKPDNIKKKISKIMRSNFKSFNESYIEERELPIRFNDDGDLLIERRNKLDFEEEYAKCHSVIKVYEKANNLDGIKYELCKLWFLNCLIQQKLHSKITESKKNELNPVWLERIAVGITQHCTFIIDITGSSTATEHLPKPVISFISAIFFW